MKFVIKYDEDIDENVLVSVVLDKSDDSVSTIVFPSEVDGEKIETVKLTYFNIDHPVRIEFEEGITYVNGFLANKHITEIKFPKSIQEIANNAFYNCSRLKKVSFAKDSCLSFISEYAFSYTSNLESFEVPSSVVKIGKMAFAYSGVKKITFEDKHCNLTRIDSMAFAFNRHLKYAEFPNTSHNLFLGESLFRDCTALEAFKFHGNNVTTITDSMFYHCLALSSINFPAALKGIRNDAFMFCHKLTNLDLSHTNLKNIARRAFYQSEIEAIKLPDTVLAIREEAFRESNLKKISLPNSLKIIEKDAFRSAQLSIIYNISVLTKVSLGAECFSDNTFETLVLPPLSDAGVKIFSNNGFLKSVDIGDTTETIPAGMFLECANLKTVNLPESVKRIEKEAFYCTYSLKTINMENVEYIGEKAFSFSNVEGFHNHKPSLVVADMAFMSCPIEDISLHPYARVSSDAFTSDAWEEYLETRLF